MRRSTSHREFPFSPTLIFPFLLGVTDPPSRWGIFRLTNPPGLPHILSCQRPGIFHPHSVDNLYTEAGHPPGHVYESPALEFEVCDLRPRT